MNKFKVGDKVITPLGVGIIAYIGKFTYSLETAYHIKIKGHELFFEEDELKSYKSAHDKLIEMGYTHNQLESDDDLIDYYERNAYNYIWFSRNEKKYRLGEVYVDIELSRILTQCLDEV